MAVLASVTTPNTDGAPDSAPRRVVAALPAAEIDVSRFERNGTVAVPYFWVRGSTEAPIESVLARDPQLTNVERIEDADGGSLFKAEWAVDSPLLDCVAGADGKVIQALGTATAWRLRVWFEERADAAAFRSCCAAGDIPLRIDRLKPLGDLASDAGVPLTDSQHQTISLAYRAGYFDEPRGVSQEELAAQLGISSSAVGGRLRRGIASIIEEVVMR